MVIIPAGAETETTPEAEMVIIPAATETETIPEAVMEITPAAVEAALGAEMEIVPAAAVMTAPEVILPTVMTAVMRTAAWVRPQRRM